MAKIVNNNNPGYVPENTGDNGMGNLLGVILLIIAVVLLLYYGLPLLRNSTGGVGVGGGGAPQIQIPKDVNVNVNPGTGTKK